MAVLVWRGLIRINNVPNAFRIVKTGGTYALEREDGVDAMGTVRWTNASAILGGNKSNADENPFLQDILAAIAGDLGVHSSA